MRGGDNAKLGIRVEIKPNRMEVEVWDQGPGLPPCTEESLFEKFTRGDPESAISGLGIGLAICRTIIRLHQGDIHAYNRLEGGASFRFWLPLTQVNPTDMILAES